jgi:hypothetical protein
MPLPAFAVARQAPSGKPPPDCLGDAHDIRYNSREFIGKERSGAADPCLHFVEDEAKVELIAQVT